MINLLIATTNKAKFNEISFYLKGLPITFLNLKDLGIKRTAPEIGNDFTKVAINKATFYYRLSKIPTIADDGGLTIDALRGEPGIKSARWLGKKTSDQKIIAYTLKRLKNIPFDKRTASLNVAICLYLKPKQYFVSTAQVSGLIALKPSKKRISGYPYRSLLWFPKFNKYYDDLTLYEHDTINHRKIALEKIRKIILNKVEDLGNTVRACLPAGRRKRELLSSLREVRRIST